MMATATALRAWTRRWPAIALVALCACAAPRGMESTPSGYSYPQADRLFHDDPRWLGGDDAGSIALSRGRILWLFGDSFIATSSAKTRASASFVHNTIAIETGDDPRTASMMFYWRQNDRGVPSSVFPDRERHWYWPGGGIRIANGPLVVFLDDIVATEGHGLGFATDGYAVAVFDNPEEVPARWQPRIVKGIASHFDAVPGAAVVRDGDYVVALAIRQKGVHAGALVRYPANALAKGDLSGAQWWMGEARGWVGAARVKATEPTYVIDDAGAECSLHWDARLRTYVHLASYGFGASAIGVRTAPALTGPWSAARITFRPPESDTSHPFVYAGKAHPELTAPNRDALLVTYVANSFEPKNLLTAEGEKSLYWPHFAVVPVVEPQK